MSYSFKRIYRTKANRSLFASKLIECAGKNICNLSVCRYFGLADGGLRLAKGRF